MAKNKIKEGKEPWEMTHAERMEHFKIAPLDIKIDDLVSTRTFSGIVEDIKERDIYIRTSSFGKSQVAVENLSDIEKIARFDPDRLYVEGKLKRGEYVPDVMLVDYPDIVEKRNNHLNKGEHMDETTNVTTDNKDKVDEKKPKSSKYIGVSYITRAKKYLASVRVNGQRIIAGYFKDEEEAARARDEAARKAGADESRMNFPKIEENKPMETANGGSAE